MAVFFLIPRKRGSVPLSSLMRLLVPLLIPMLRSFPLVSSSIPMQCGRGRLHNKYHEKIEFELLKMTI